MAVDDPKQSLDGAYFASRIFGRKWPRQTTLLGRPASKFSMCATTWSQTACIASVARPGDVRRHDHVRPLEDCQSG